MRSPILYRFSTFRRWNFLETCRYPDARSVSRPWEFVRVDYKTNTKTLMDLIQKRWNLGQPKLLISVTGGANNFPLNSNLKDVFRRGLIEAARSTDAWIITGGSNSGVMKYVGEAVRDYAIAEGGSASASIVAIGIATWGILDQQEALTRSKSELPSGHISYRMDQQERTGLVRLDPNHTHFILVDDGTTGKFGKEIQLRSDLEKQISEQKVTQENGEKLNIPTVCVVVGGGPNTIQTVYRAVKNGTPCLIIDRSGRSANILAYAFNNHGTYSESVRGEIKKRLLREFKDLDLDKHPQWIEECIRQPNLINVYKLNAGRGVSTDIDKAILHALLKAKKGMRIDQLQLAMVWNRVDVAKSEIFTDDNDWKMGELNESVRYAIKHDLPNFLELFIENGVSMKDYLTEDELTILYGKIKQTSLLYCMLKKINEKKDTENDVTLWMIGQIIQQLTMDTYEPLYLSDEKQINQGGLPKSDNSDHCGCLKKQQNVAHVPAMKSQAAQFHPIRELFLYAILLNRKDMARKLWERIDEPIAAALTASKMLKAMACKECDQDQKKSMMEHADIYEELAIGVLKVCYGPGEDRTNNMMRREMPNWGGTTCLTMAVQAQNRKFIAQSAVQNLLTEIWMGKISNENNYWKLWLYMFFPWMVALHVSFKEDEHCEKYQGNAVTVNEPDDSEGIGDDQEMVVKVDNGVAPPPTKADW